MYRFAIIILLLASCRSPERQEGWTLPFVTKETKYSVGDEFAAHHHLFVVLEVADRYLIGVDDGGNAQFWMSEEQMNQAMGRVND